MVRNNEGTSALPYERRNLPQQMLAGDSPPQEALQVLSDDFHTSESLSPYWLNQIGKLPDADLQSLIMLAGDEYKAAMSSLDTYHAISMCHTMITVAGDINSGFEVVTDHAATNANTKETISLKPLAPAFDQTILWIGNYLANAQARANETLGNSFAEAYANHIDRADYLHAAIWTLDDAWEKSHDGPLHAKIPPRLRNSDPRKRLGDWQDLYPSEEPNPSGPNKTVSSIVDFQNVRSLATTLWGAALAIEEKCPEYKPRQVSRVLFKNAANDGDLGRLAWAAMNNVNAEHVYLRSHAGKLAGSPNAFCTYMRDVKTRPQFNEITGEITIPDFNIKPRGRCPMQYYMRLEKGESDIIGQFLDEVEQNYSTRIQLIYNRDDVASVNLSQLLVAEVIYLASKSGHFLSQNVSQLTEQFVHAAYQSL